MSFCLSGCYWKPEFKTKHLTGREGRQSEKWGHFWWNLFSLQQSSCWTVWASSLWDLDIIVTVITKTNYRPNVLYNCQKVCSSSSNCESALHPICKLASKICFPAAVCCSAEPLYCKIYAWLVKFVMQKKCDVSETFYAAMKIHMLVISQWDRSEVLRPCQSTDAHRLAAWQFWM